MSAKNYSVLCEKEEEKKRLAAKKDYLIGEVDRLWDDGASDMEIKDFIKSVALEVYPKRGPSYINNFVEDFFIYLTAGLPVRIHLNKEQIRKLKRVKLEVSGNEAHNTCVTCQDEFKLDDEVIILPCKHIFHENCIVPWLKMNVTCPTCRHDVRN